MKKLLILVFIMVVLCVSNVFSNGFQINEQGTKALGMGGAFVAQADDPSAVYFNPAGITQLERFQFSVGLSPIVPSATFKSSSGNSTDTKDKVFLIPNLYATLKVNEHLSVGLGIFANYGLGTEWPDDWEGRYITGGTKTEIETLTINPNIAYMVNKKLSLAVGIDFQSLDITLENKVRIVPNGTNYMVLSSDGTSSLEGSNWAIGWNAALHYKITDDWSVGASYRSKIKHKIKDGTLTMRLPSSAVYDQRFTNTGLTLPAMEIQKSGSSKLTMPEILYIGTSYTLGKFTFELDGQWTGWTSYNKLRVEFEDNTAPIEKPKSWNDVWAIRFGAQYKVNDILSLRAGIIRDFSPIPDDTLDPLVPSGDRWIYAIGFGLNFTNWVFDFAYNYLNDETRTFNNKVGKEAPYGTPAVPYTVRGKFKGIDAHIFGMNVTYKF
jgi:long-chain fatty acid transport protein